MQQQLIDLNPDLKRLSDEGYELEIDGGHLLVHHIPYVISTKEVKYGTLVCILTLVSPTKTAAPQDHTIYFCGNTPCNADGSELTAIINNSITRQLTDRIIVNHYFSSKPISGNYIDYHDKIRTYCEILSSQAKLINDNVAYRPKRKIEI